MALSEPMALENLLKIIAGEMDPTSGHIHLEVGKRMSVLNQNHNMFDESTVETVMMGNKTLYAIKKKWMLCI
jgi:ATPase subunit of ABC transporter with duplicated ATPase domains